MWKAREGLMKRSRGYESQRRIGPQVGALGKTGVAWSWRIASRMNRSGCTSCEVWTVGSLERCLLKV